MATVHLVDDDAGIREAVRALLEEDGYTVSESATTEAALAFLRATPERMVVLLDLLMPNSSVDLLAVLNADHALWRRHAYILCTGTTAGNIPQTALNLNMPILYKPFELDAILKMVATATAQLLVPIMDTPQLPPLAL